MTDGKSSANVVIGIQSSVHCRAMSCRSGSATRKSLGERGTTVCCKSCTAILLEPVTSGCSTFASRINLLTNGYNVETRTDTSACLASDTHSFYRSSSNRDPLRLEKITGKPDEHNHRRTLYSR